MVGLLALLLLATATIVDGLLRWAINQPIDAVRDLGGVIAAAAMSCCLPLVFASRANITVRFISTFVGGQSSRIANIVAACLVVAVLGGMSYEFYLFAGESFRGGETTPLLGIPVAPFWYWVDAMMGTAAIVQVTTAIEEAAELFASDLPVSPHGD
jgi:TRAP-type transport system small permease protein